MPAIPGRSINGIDLDAADRITGSVRDDPARARVGVRICTDWKGQMRSESTVETRMEGGDMVRRGFTISSDEPRELLGTDSAPNPQELLLSALNACMMVGYVAQASARGITLTGCRIETEGELDLRGVLGLERGVSPGYRRIHYKVALEGDGSPRAYEEIHEAVMATSPNFFHLAQPIQMCGRLV